MKNKKTKNRILFIIPMGLMVFAAGLPVFNWLQLVLGKVAWTFMPFWVIAGASLSMSYAVSSKRLQLWLHRIGEAWFGAALYILLPFFVRSIVLLTIKAFGIHPDQKVSIISGWCAFALSAGCYLTGVINALRVKTVRIALPANVEKPLRVVLLSDLHLGFFTGRRMLDRIVAASNKENPDIVAIAGDFFDMEYNELKNPGLKQKVMAKLKSKLGVYACLGNHDMLSSDIRKNQWITGSGISILRDEFIELPDIVILGRRDIRDSLRMAADEVYKNLPSNKPLIVLDHNPENYREAWDNGAALVLSGHTHGGQTFPGNLLQPIVMSSPIYGMKAEGTHHLFVTSGAGFWGPPLRLGINNEIVRIDIMPVG